MGAGAPLSAAARRAERLGVLGGSFDPPHLGHLHAAESARRAFALDHVLFVPAARPPHKPERILAEGAERLTMLALLLHDQPACSVWDVELDRSGPSYTIDTLRELGARVPAARLYFILGEDNLAGFQSWHAIEELVRLAQPIVVHRRGAGQQGARPELARLSAFARTRLALGQLAGAALDASSSALRGEFAQGAVPHELLPERLRRFIEERALYRRP